MHKSTRAGHQRDRSIDRETDAASAARRSSTVSSSYGSDHLGSVLVNGYVAKLLTNTRIVKFLTQHYAEILTEFRKLVDVNKATA